MKSSKSHAKCVCSSSSLLHTAAQRHKFHTTCPGLYRNTILTLPRISWASCIWTSDPCPCHKMKWSHYFLPTHKVEVPRPKFPKKTKWPSRPYKMPDQQGHNHIRLCTAPSRQARAGEWETQLYGASIRTKELTFTVNSLNRAMHQGMGL